MTQPSYDLGRVLAEIAHTLESVTDSDARVERAMTLLGGILPYSRCALLEVADDDARKLYIVPEGGDHERRRMTETMNQVYQLVSRAEQIGRSNEPSPSLSLPVIGLDSTIGVFRVEPSDTVYDVTHLRVLAVVGAQLGAYLTTRRLYERDRRREEKLAAAHDFQQLLAGVVSHDLRNPLAVISMVASNLLASTSDERQAASLRRALRNAEHAARLIADLADVTEARVSGTLSLSPHEKALADFARTIIDDLRTANPSATIELACNVPPGTTVAWDVERVVQMIGNLVNNAIAHGAVQQPVRVTIGLDGEDVVIEVHNFGPPIPAENLPTLFDPFTHGTDRPRARSARGLGLGLYIVAQIVTSHGGVITVSSREPDGTTFTVRLPRVCSAHRPATNGEGPLLMIIDDDEDVRTGLAGLLQKRGFRVAVAGDGRAALDLLHTGVAPMLILLDLSMPRMTGEELTDAMQQEPALASIPIIVISADTAAAARFSRDRARAVLPKPVSVEQLLATIETIH